MSHSGQACFYFRALHVLFPVPGISSLRASPLLAYASPFSLLVLYADVTVWPSLTTLLKAEPRAPDLLSCSLFSPQC